MVHIYTFINRWNVHLESKYIKLSIICGNLCTAFRLPQITDIGGLSATTTIAVWNTVKWFLQDWSLKQINDQLILCFKLKISCIN